MPNPASFNTTDLKVGQSYYDAGFMTISTNVDANGRFARNTVTFADGAQAYLDIYDTVIIGTTTARPAQLDIRLTNVKYQHHIPWHDPSLRAAHMEVLADSNHEGN